MLRDAAEDAELAAAYVVSCVAARAGSRLQQGARKVPLVARSFGPSLDLVATTRLRGVSQPVSDALVAWAKGERRVHLLFAVPRPADVLAWQAAGERCVSLLPEGVSSAPHEDGLAFAMHDLCHLEKFTDPEHHVGQVGFFFAMHEVMRRAEWMAFAGKFDDDFARELEHVVADMNGSAVFLFAALKMKLKMAVRRRVARSRETAASVGGPLDAEEHDAFVVELRALLDLLGADGWDEAARDGALTVRTRRDDRDAALAVLRHFEALGSATLSPR